MKQTLFFLIFIFLLVACTPSDLEPVMVERVTATNEAVQTVAVVRETATSQPTATTKPTEVAPTPTVTREPTATRQPPTPVPTPTPVVPMVTDTPVLEAQGVQLVGHFGGWLNGHAAWGDYVYAGIGYQFAILDFNQGDTAQRVGSVVLGKPIESVVTNGRYAFVLHEDNTLTAIDVSDVQAPTLRQHWTNLLDPQLVTGVDGNIYYIDYHENYWLLGVSDEQLITQVEILPDLAGEMTRRTSNGYINEVPVNMNPELTPYIVEAMPQYAFAYNITLTEDTLYFEASSDFVDPILIALDIEVFPPVIKGTYISSRPSSIVYESSYLYNSYVDDTSGGFNVFDLSDVSNPIQIPSTLRTAGNGFTIVDNTLYTGLRPGVMAWDISDPTQPISQAMVSPTDDGLYGSADMIVVENTLVALLGVYAGQGTGFLLADISNRNRLVLLAHLGLSERWKGDVGELASDDRFLYAMRGKGLEIFDISNPEQFETVGWYQLEDGSYGHQVALGEFNGRSYAYITESEESNPRAKTNVLVIDITVPNDPQLVGSYEVTTECPDRRTKSSELDLLVQDNLLYASLRHCGLHILDLSDPTQPQQVGYFEQGGQLQMDGQTLYVSGQAFFILELAEELRP